MNPNDVIETFVADVMRRVPGKERNDIGLELRGLLTDMLDERAAAAGHAADDAMVLAMLRDFGTPAEVAARYQSPDTVIIPAVQTRTFALLSLTGVGLQWALTLPRVFQGQPIVAWWFSWGLGSLWWPGFLFMMALAAAGVRALGLPRLAWRPRDVDSERIHRRAWALGLAGCVIGAAFMVCLPWIVEQLPGPLPQVFAFDPEFLRRRAPFVLPLWLLAFANAGIVYRQGRWSDLTRRLQIAVDLAFAVLLSWWLVGGAMFQAEPTNNGARGGIALVTIAIALGALLQMYRRYARRAPKLAG
jgi:hypothetical protein